MQAAYEALCHHHHHCAVTPNEPRHRLLPDPGGPIHACMHVRAHASTARLKECQRAVPCHARPVVHPHAFTRTRGFHRTSQGFSLLWNGMGLKPNFLKPCPHVATQPNAAVRAPLLSTRCPKLLSSLWPFCMD